jgi:hypothetical protein
MAELLAADVNGDVQSDADTPIPLLTHTDDAYTNPTVPFDGISIWELSVDLANIGDATLYFKGTIPVNSVDSILPCTGTNFRQCIPQPSTTVRLDFSSYGECPT